MKDIWRSFSHQVVDLDAARAQLDSGATIGTADVLVAVYDYPDDYPAVGNTARQIIDKGAFKPFVEKYGDAPRPFFLDHGDFTKGYTNSQLQIGVARNYRDSADGLYVESNYNLKTQVGREAFENLVFEPSVWEYSFRNKVADEEHARGEDGYDHVTAFHNVREFSQVVWGAQGRTGALAGTIAARLEHDPDLRRELLEILRDGEAAPAAAGGAVISGPVGVTTITAADMTSAATQAPVTTSTSSDLLITSSTVPAKVFSPEVLSNRGRLVEELRDPAIREAVKEAIAESERPSAMTELLNTIISGSK